MSNKQKRLFNISMLLLYLMVLFYLVFLCKAFGRTDEAVIRYQSMNWQLFKTIKHYIYIMPYVDKRIVLTNLLGNIMVFLPLGYLLPLLWKKFRHGLIIVMLSTFLSMSIEIIQGYLRIGVLDIDDVLLNVLGGLIGYIIFVLVERLRK